MNIRKEQQKVPGEISRPANRISRFIMHFIMPAAALACGVLITVYLLKTGPQAKPGKRTPAATLVEIQKLRAEPQQTLISAMGEIIPARKIDIKPQINGEIITTSEEFQLGGYFRTGEEILAIDRTDYELILRQLESDVAKAESDLALEMGNQRIAEREYTLLGEEVSSEEKNLILRKPQLAKLRAVRDDALARLSQARLNLDRTTIRAPFNGVIAEKQVDIGAKVGESTTLATIVGTDTFWLRLTLPVEQLQWLNIPGSSTGNGANVTIFPQGSTSTSYSRSGQVVRLIAALEDQGRMAQLLVRIDDPLSLKNENLNKPQLLLGSYVRAEIEGISIDSGYRIARSNLHDGNTVWLMNDEGKLDIRQVEVSYRGRDTVIVKSGISNDENLVVSTLAAPITGTPLRLIEDSNAVEERIAGKDDAEAGKGGKTRVN